MGNDVSTLFLEFMEKNKYKSREWKSIATNIQKYIASKRITNPVSLSEYIDSSRGDKSQAKELISDFCTFYSERTQRKVESGLESVFPVDVPSLRRLEILKYLHDPHTTDEIATHFGVSPDTIRSDLGAIENGYNLFGMRLEVVHREKSRKKVKYYHSVVHPIFLALNSTEVHAMTVTLRKIAEEKQMSDIYLPIISKIYMQLSDYGKKEVIGKGTPKFEEGLPEVDTAFRDEEKWIMGSAEIGSMIEYSHKFGDLFFVVIDTGSGEQVIDECRIVPSETEVHKYTLHYHTADGYQCQDVGIDEIKKLTVKKYRKPRP